MQFENLSDSVSNVQILNNIVQWWFSWNLENTFCSVYIGNKTKPWQLLRVIKLPQNCVYGLSRPTFIQMKVCSQGPKIQSWVVLIIRHFQISGKSHRSVRTISKMHILPWSLLEEDPTLYNYILNIIFQTLERPTLKKLRVCAGVTIIFFFVFVSLKEYILEIFRNCWLLSVNM